MYKFPKQRYITDKIEKDLTRRGYEYKRSYSSWISANEEAKKEREKGNCAIVYSSASNIYDMPNNDLYVKDKQIRKVVEQ